MSHPDDKIVTLTNYFCFCTRLTSPFNTVRRHTWFFGFAMLCSLLRQDGQVKPLTPENSLRELEILLKNPVLDIQHREIIQYYVYSLPGGMHRRKTFWWRYIANREHIRMSKKHLSSLMRITDRFRSDPDAFHDIYPFIKNDGKGYFSKDIEEPLRVTLFHLLFDDHRLR